MIKNCNIDKRHISNIMKVYIIDISQVSKIPKICTTDTNNVYSHRTLNLTSVLKIIVTDENVNSCPSTGPRPP